MTKRKRNEIVDISDVTERFQNGVKEKVPYLSEKPGKLLATPGVSAQPGCIE